jgi:DNA-binding CsgD family transcriptional regulator
MSGLSPIGRYVSSPADLKARIEAERVGSPFLLYRDGQGQQRIVALPQAGVITIGRRLTNDVVIDWDTEVSRVHARLEEVGGDWTIVDDGLSRNGSWVNDERLTSRRRLRDRDAVRIGNTTIAFLQPGERESDATLTAAEQVAIADLTDRQREILIALARPFKDPDGLALPATNQQVADEVHLSVDAVKGHLRALFHKFGVDDLPQNQKRAQLVWRAFRSGAISAGNLWD